jgi:hypothetical protein
MTVSKEKADALSKLVGQELADQTLKDAEKATSILEQAGISFKEDEDDVDAKDNENLDAETGDEEVTDEDEETAEDDKEQLYELEVTDELVKEIAAKVDIKTGVKEAVDISIKGLKESIIAELTPVITQAINAAIAANQTNVMGQKEAIVQQALSGKIKLTPWSASGAKETTVGDDLLTAAKEAKTGKKQRDVVADVVSNMLGGKVQ